MTFRSKVVLVVIILAALLVLAGPALAQDTGPNLVVPDLSTLIQQFSQGLSDFWGSTAVIMGLLAYLAVQVLKWALPSTVIQTETIYGVVVAIFGAIYVIVQLAGQGAFLGQVVDVGTLIANALLTILAGMGVVASVTYSVMKRVNNPVFGGHQGDKKFSLVAPDKAAAAAGNYQPGVG